MCHTQKYKIDFENRAIVFTFTGSVRNVRNVADTKSVHNLLAIFRSEIHSFAPDFISEESFRPEEFFEVLF